MTRLTALAGILTISFSAIFVRLADVAPTTAALYRAAYAVPVLWVIHRLVADRRAGRLRILAGAAGLLLAVDITLWHTSIGLVGAGLATVVANTQVLWVGGAAWMLHGERPSVTAFVVVPIVLFGVALIGGAWSQDAFGENPAAGAVIALGAGFFYAGFLLVFRSATRDRRATAGPLFDTTVGIAVAMSAIAWFDPGFSITPTWPAHGWLLALALPVHTGGWLLIAHALPRLPALETSVMLLLQPAATIVWAGLIFDERLAGAQWMGVMLVLAGVAAAAARGTVRPPEVERPRGP